MVNGIGSLFEIGFLTLRSLAMNGSLGRCLRFDDCACTYKIWAALLNWGFGCGVFLRNLAQPNAHCFSEALYCADDFLGEKES